MTALAALHELQTLADLDAVLASPGLVLLYKHSTACNVSADAAREVNTFLLGTAGTSAADTGFTAYRVTVQRARPVADAIETRFGIRHETPQVILLRGGQPLWHASHWRVTATALADAMAGAGAT